MNLTSSLQNYLKMTYELSATGKGVRVSDIAAKLNVSKSSVCLAVQKLQKHDLVTRDAERLIYLTSAGEREAVMAYDKFAILQQFLLDELGVSPATAASDASEIEHLISYDTLCALCRLVNQGKQASCRVGCHKGMHCVSG
ncbi:metal-dependent transcriptional regulator [Clostridium minihomine]|uniref:metal-dependent transcriptional regulator n=1 Tax=Clostridium minihomine TaxID=2045012 RepID=UPI0013EA6373|nr:metal-dependent transcriptional regulator [Clostridium minihomine]